MRKSIYILAAVATMLVSCGETEKINNDLKDTTEPRVIGFSSFSEKATKGDGGNSANILNLEYFHNTFAVYGTKENTQTHDKEYVFGESAATTAGVKGGTECTYTGDADASFYGSNWSYTDLRYWDRQAEYDFIAYAPALDSNPLRYKYNAVGAEVGDAGNDFVATDYVLTGKNLQAKATAAAKNKGFNVNDQDLDLMTSASQSQLGTVHTPVQLTFKHILSKINVIIGKSETLDNADVLIDEVTITKLVDKGSYAESRYDGVSTPRVSGWTPAATNDDADYVLKYETSAGEPYLPDTDGADTYNVNPLYFIESLVIPQTIANDAKVTVKYHINSEAYTYVLVLKDAFTEFFDRYNYNLTFTIGPSVITFDASAYGWADLSYEVKVPYVEP